MYAAILTDIPDLAYAVAGCLAFGALAALAYSLKQRNTMPSQTDPEPPKKRTSAEAAMAMIRGGILREFNLLPGPLQRIEFLQMLRAESADLYSIASGELYAAKEQHQQLHPLTHPINAK